MFRRAKNEKAQETPLELDLRRSHIGLVLGLAGAVLAVLAIAALTVLPTALIN